MPSIKGNTNYNNGSVSANIKPKSISISAQIPQTQEVINSSLETNPQSLNATINQETNYIRTNINSSSNIVRADAQAFNSATTEKKGIARIATLEEVIEGEDNSTIVTPYTLKNTVINDKHYTYEQTTPSDVWVVTHNLNKKPSIEVVDSAENVVIGAYEYNNLNTVTLRFNGAFVGKAYFN